jgi:hypothetical protein
VFVSLWAIYRIPFTARKAFLLRFQDISAGDSPATVRTKLGPYTAHVVEDDGECVLLYVRHWNISRDDDYNADIGEIRLKKDVVTGKRFLPD